MEFEWDPVKEASNIRDHDGVDFTTAQLVFEDPNRIERYKPERGEERFWVLGGAGALLLVVIYVERNSKIRIISARKATKREKAFYRNR